MLRRKFNSVQLLSHVQHFATPWNAAHQASLSITSSWSSLKLMCIELVMPSNHLILCWPLLILCWPLVLLPSILYSIRVFSNESVLLIKWPKYWSFSISISPSNEYSRLISFRIDWFDLLQSKRLSRVFFSTIIQKHKSSVVLSLLYGTTLTFVHNSWKNHSFDYIDLCRQSDVSAC